MTVPTNPAAIARRKTAGSLRAPAMTDIDFTLFAEHEFGMENCRWRKR
jgi:hypothetical protein